jgi:hypothetical protein
MSASDSKRTARALISAVAKHVSNSAQREMIYRDVLEELGDGDSLQVRGLDQAYDTVLDQQHPEGQQPKRQQKRQAQAARQPAPARRAAQPDPPQRQPTLHRSAPARKTNQGKR